MGAKSVKRSKYLQYSDEQKIRIVRDIMVEVATTSKGVTASTRQRGLSTTTYYKWKKEFASHLTDLLQAEAEAKAVQLGVTPQPQPMESRKPGILYDFLLQDQPLCLSREERLFNSWDRIRSRKCNLMEVGRICGFHFEVKELLFCLSLKSATPPNQSGLEEPLCDIGLKTAISVLKKIQTEVGVKLVYQDRLIYEEALLTMSQARAQEIEESDTYKADLSEFVDLDPQVLIPGVEDLPVLRCTLRLSQPIRFSPERSITAILSSGNVQDSRWLINDVTYEAEDGTSKALNASLCFAMRGDIITPIIQR